MAGNFNWIKNTLIGLGAITLIGGILDMVHEHGRSSAIDDIYHKHNGWVVIPGVTDEEGKFYKDEE